jgi:hypothetical protein
LLDEREMLGAKGAAPVDVVVHDVVDQEEVHDIVKDSVCRTGLNPHSRGSLWIQRAETV